MRLPSLLRLARSRQQGGVGLLADTALHLISLQGCCGCEETSCEKGGGSRLSRDRL